MRVAGIWIGTHEIAPRAFTHYDRIPALAREPTRSTNRSGAPGDPLNVAFVADSAEVAAAGLEAGFIVNNPTPERIRLAPPLVLTEGQADTFLAAWPGLLDAAYRASP